MEQTPFRDAVCRHFNIEDKAYIPFVLKHSLSNRARLLLPLIKVFSPDFLFNEVRLIERVGKALSMKEIQEEIDFYHHKFVTQSISKDALRFRISGMRLMRLANKVFHPGHP